MKLLKFSIHLLWPEFYEIPGIKSVSKKAHLKKLILFQIWVAGSLKEAMVIFLKCTNRLYTVSNDISTNFPVIIFLWFVSTDFNLVWSSMWLQAMDLFPSLR